MDERIYEEEVEYHKTRILDGDDQSEYVVNDVLLRSQKDADKVNYPKLYPEFPSSKPHLAFYSSNYVEGQQTPNQWNYKSPPFHSGAATCQLCTRPSHLSAVDRV